MQQPAASGGPDANKALVREFFDVLNKWNGLEAFAFLSDQGSWWAAGDLYAGDRRVTGAFSKAEYMALFKEIQASFPNGVMFTIHAMTAEGDRVAAEVESRGRHANGGLYNNRYHFLFVVENGKFSLIKEYNDTHHLFELIQANGAR
ncbi:MAG: nuclear transport factor 2 family protein [Hyphomonadaceae bacterium]|nr:nuclear transport factor 2 family protein [Hyphomonadaceae bacterium]